MIGHGIKEKDHSFITAPVNCNLSFLHMKIDYKVHCIEIHRVQAKCKLSPCGYKNGQTVLIFVTGCRGFSFLEQCHCCLVEGVVR